MVQLGEHHARHLRSSKPLAEVEALGRLPGGPNMEAFIIPVGHNSQATRGQSIGQAEGPQEPDPVPFPLRVGGGTGTGEGAGRRGTLDRNTTGEDA